MPAGTLGFVGPRLKEAREARGINGVSLAELVGVTRQAISQYETGSSKPSPETLEKIAASLNLPIAFFLTNAPPFDDAPVYFRSLSAATKSARLRERRRLLWHRHIVDFLSTFADLPEPRVPTLDAKAPAEISDEEIEEAAEQTREQWQLAPGPVAHVVDALETHGAIVVRSPLGADSLDAYSTWFGERPHVVLSDDKRSAVRSRYDAAHELGHLVLHRYMSTTTVSTPADVKELERQAHAFAGAFLLPAATFAGDVSIPTLDGFLALKVRWGASVGAMVMRARALSLVDDDQGRRLWVGYSSRGWRRREPYDDELAIEQPRILRAAFDIAKAEIGSVAQLRLTLPYARTDIEQLTSLPPGYLEQEIVAPVRSKITKLRSGHPGIINFPSHPRTNA